MKRPFKRITALLLAAVCLFALCACSKDGGTDSGGDQGKSGGKKGSSSQALVNRDLDTIQKVSLEHVYTSRRIDSPVAPTPQIVSNSGQEYRENLNNMYYIGGQLFATVYGYRYWEEDNVYHNQNSNKIFRIDADTGASELIYESTEVTDDSYTEGQTVYSSSYKGNFVPAPDGTVWYSQNDYFEDYTDPDNYIYENKNTLFHVDAQGNELGSIESTELSDDEYFYFNSLMPLEDGSLAVISEKCVLFVDAQGNLRSRIELPGGDNSWINSSCVMENGDVIISCYSWNDVTYENSNQLMRLSPQTGACTPLDIPTDSTMDLYNFQGGSGNSIYVNNSTGIFSLDLATGEKKEVLNWLNSDINSSRINRYIPISGDRFVVAEMDRDYTNTNLSVLSPASGGDLIEKYIITLAAVYNPSDLTDTIIEFNKQNEQFRIQLVDYSQYSTEENNYNGGREQMNLDMISGNVPDLILLDSLPYENYVSKGLLQDLTQLMEEDETFDKSEYLQNIFESTAVNGKIYSVFPSFFVMTVSGKSANVGTQMGWTLDDLKALMQRFPDAAVFDENTDRSTILQQFSSLSMGSYVNWATGDCKFNTPEFVGMLELINSFPEEIDWQHMYEDLPEDYWEKEQFKFRDDKVLLSMEYLSSFGDIRGTAYKYRTFDFTYVGFPNPGGIGSCIQPSSEFAISSKTKLTAACWDFIKTLLGKQFQSDIKYQFPVRTDCLEALMEEARNSTDPGMIQYDDYVAAYGDYTKSEEEADEVETAEEAGAEDGAEDGETDETATDNTVIGADEPIAIEEPIGRPVGGDEEYNKYYGNPLTQEQLDKVYDLIKSVTTVARDNTELLNIIQEESAAYFSGQKTAQAVADVIQSKAWIYVSERS